MATDIEGFLRELRAFDARREVLKEIRKEIKEPLPQLRKAWKAWALSNLPSRGGLNRWVARARIQAKFSTSGRIVGVRVILTRKSGGGDKADLNRLDSEGRIRHPLYGNRQHWYPQTVKANVFTRVWEMYEEQWVRSAEKALDRALDKIRKG